MKLLQSIPETHNYLQQIQEKPELLFSLMRSDITLTVGKFINLLMIHEMTANLGREKYEHSKKGINDSNEEEVKEGKPIKKYCNHRNGYYSRSFTLKGIGTINVFVPRDRLGKYKTDVLPRYKRYEKEIRNDICMMYLTGISTRSLSMISDRLLGRSISPTEVSRCSKEIVGSIEEWRTRDLSNETYKYLFIDGVLFPMRNKHSIEKVPVLVIIGITEDGDRKVLLIQAGDKESASTWRECFKDLKRRGLKGSDIELGVMDGLPGLEKVFKQEFCNSKVQRCQVHVARNILAKVPRKQKQEVADEVRSIFYASSKPKAIEFFVSFKDKWQSTLPSAVKCLENSLESCTNYYSFKEEEWISLRTTNMIERLNKEFKRRTKPMEIVAGEASCYQLLGFISLKMELHWRCSRFGKVKKTLPFYRQMKEKEG